MGKGAIDLFWLPLGAGGHFVRFNGRVYEYFQARREHRPVSDLYHTALEVTVPDGRYIIENSWPIPGGTMVELMRDVAVRITPLTDLDANEMVRSLRSWPLFEGYRGQAPLSAPEFEGLLLRLSAMVEDIPYLAELDLNPVLVSSKECIVLDARIRMAAPKPPPPRGARTIPKVG
jgi:hypothetical protein